MLCVTTLAGSEAEGFVNTWFVLFIVLFFELVAHAYCSAVLVELCVGFWCLFSCLFYCEVAGKRSIELSNELLVLLNFAATNLRPSFSCSFCSVFQFVPPTTHN